MRCPLARHSKRAGAAQPLRSSWRASPRRARCASAHSTTSTASTTPSSRLSSASCKRRRTPPPPPSARATPSAQRKPRLRKRSPSDSCTWAPSQTRRCASSTSARTRARASGGTRRLTSCTGPCCSSIRSRQCLISSKTLARARRCSTTLCTCSARTASRRPHGTRSTRTRRHVSSRTSTSPTTMSRSDGYLWTSKNSWVSN
mmetsp:Transcript_35877/g.75438  ORF Transcript_35877/g.75438 Transcript_35877/m.75438 type:complete len:202 (+) Transcript_35877:1281-1886(+)